MPTALSPTSSRVRSRTSDISDFLRGGSRNEPKTSTDLPARPPISLIPEPATPTKSRSKFAFLGRKRKTSFSPSAAKASPSTTPAPAAGRSSSHVPSGNHPSPAGPTVRGTSRDLPPLPPLSIIAPGYRPPHSTSSRPSLTLTSMPSTAPVDTRPPSVQYVRKQKGSSESRRSTDSRSSMRPIITVSPPHNTMHDTPGAYVTPRSAPLPSGSNASSPLRTQHTNDFSLPTPTASDRSDQASNPDSPVSADVPTPSTSTHSLAQSASLHSTTDTSIATATSYKEESLLRKDHFEVESDVQQRRGTVSFNSNTQPAPATVGHAPSRHARRQISLVQLNKLKKEIAATATPPTMTIRKISSESTSLASQASQQQRRASALVRNFTVGSTPPQSRSSSSPQGSRAPTPQGRKIPPPLKRTWHTPPTTGPPKEPLPSPPASGSGARALQTPTTADSFRTAASSPVSPRRRLSQLIPSNANSKDPGSGSGAKSPDSIATSSSIPSSPARSEADLQGSGSGSGSGSLRTPIREDTTLKVLADENASAEQLRDALRLQSEKYARLSTYLLSLTERHALEKAELMRRVEVLEGSVGRYEREMKGLRWLVANGGRAPAPGSGSVRADLPHPSSSSTSGSGSGIPQRAQRSGARDRSSSAATMRSVRSIASDLDSSAGSVEHDLVELQTAISDFIAPVGSPTSPRSDRMQQPSIRESLAPHRHGAPPVLGLSGSGVGTGTRTRMRRSNTVPNEIGGSPQIPVPTSVPPVPAPASQVSKQQKTARRTSSPVVPSPSLSSSPHSSNSKRSSIGPGTLGGKAGLGLGMGMGMGMGMGRDRSPSPDGRDPHARSDSSTLSSLPSLSTLSSAASGLSSIPETPRTDGGVLPDVDEHSDGEEPGGGKADRGRFSFSSARSIGQVLDRSGTGSGSVQRQPEMEAILKRLRAFGQSGSP